MLDRLKQTEASPWLIGAAAALAAGILAFFLIVLPGMQEAEAVRRFNDPAAEARRDPDRRTAPPGLAEAVAKVRAKYGRPGSARQNPAPARGLGARSGDGQSS